MRIELTRLQPLILVCLLLVLTQQAPYSSCQASWLGRMTQFEIRSKARLVSLTWLLSPFSAIEILMPKTVCELIDYQSDGLSH